MKKLMSKLLAFALVATLAFALTGCFVTPNSAITFNKYPEATYVAGTSENSALSSIVVTLTENGTKVKEGNLADLEKEGVIVVEGFDLKTEGPNKTAKIIFGTAVVSFSYTVVAESVTINDEAKLVEVLSSTSEETVVASLGKDITLAAALTASAKHVVLDLNGKTISTTLNGVSVSLITINEGAKLELKNGSITQPNGILHGIFQVNGELVIHSGTYTDYGYNRQDYITDYRSNGAMIYVSGNGSLTIYNGTFNNEKHADAGEKYGRAIVFVNSATATAKIYDGIFDHKANTNNGAYAIRSNGTFFMYGGTVTSERGALSAQSGAFDVRGGTFVSTAAAGASCYTFYIAGERGDVSGIVSGGTFKSNTASVLQIGNSNDGGEKLSAALRIIGGTFEAGESARIVSIDAQLGNVDLAGGTFNKKPEGAIAEGYAAVEENGVWTVKAI